MPNPAASHRRLGRGISPPTRAQNKMSYPETHPTPNIQAAKVKSHQPGRNAPPAGNMAREGIMQDEPADIHPDGAHYLVIAIIDQGVEDVLKGDPGALSWLDSRDFDHWCAWVGIAPDRARQAIHARRATVQPKYSAEELRRANELYDSGRTWKDAVTEVFGYYSETLRYTVIRYCNGQAV